MKKYIRGVCGRKETVFNKIKLVVIFQKQIYAFLRPTRGSNRSSHVGEIGKLVTEVAGLLIVMFGENSLKKTKVDYLTRFLSRHYNIRRCTRKRTITRTLKHVRFQNMQQYDALMIQSKN